GTIAKRVGLAKRLKPAKGLPFSSSRVGRQRPVRNSLDHLVGELLQIRRYIEAQGYGGLHVDDQLEFSGLDDRKVSDFRTFHDLSDVGAGLAPRLGQIGAIADQTTRSSIVAQWVERGQCMARCQRGELVR